MREGHRLPLAQCALLMDGFVVADGVAARFAVAGGAAWINQLRTRTELIVPGGVHREAIMRSGVFADRLVARDTVEERILEPQKHKRALADAILAAGEGGLRGLRREDLDHLLT